MTLSNTMLDAMAEIARKTTGRGLDTIHETRLWAARRTLDGLISRKLVEYPTQGQIRLSTLGRYELTTREPAAMAAERVSP